MGHCPPGGEELLAQPLVSNLVPRDVPISEIEDGSEDPGTHAGRYSTPLFIGIKHECQMDTLNILQISSF